MSLVQAVNLVLENDIKPKTPTFAFMEETDHSRETEVKFAMQYLDVFGYFTRWLEDWKNIKWEDIKKALGTFQSFFGLSVTNRVDARTIRAMQQPRCGHVDIFNKKQKKSAGALAIKAFVAENVTKWQNTGLTYYIEKFVSGLSQEIQAANIQGAFDAWSQYTNFTATRVTKANQASIVISTGSGPASNFDGPGGVLAWCYLPTGNDNQLLMRYDVQETWINNPQERGILHFNVTCHELGHGLGLDHSRMQSALMAPYYSTSVATPQQNDDIPRIQKLYGVRITPPLPPTPPGPPPSGQTKRVLIEFNGIGKVSINGVEQNV